MNSYNLEAAASQEACAALELFVKPGAKPSHVQLQIQPQRCLVAFVFAVKLGVAVGP